MYAETLFLVNVDQLEWTIARTRRVTWLDLLDPAPSQGVTQPADQAIEPVKQSWSQGGVSSAYYMLPASSVV